MRALTTAWTNSSTNDETLLTVKCDNIHKRLWPSDKPFWMEGGVFCTISVAQRFLTTEQCSQRKRHACILKVLGRPHTPGERVRLATWPAGMFQCLQCRAQCCLQHLTGDTSVRGMMFLCLCSPSFFFLLMVSCVQNTAIDIYHLQSDNPPPPLTWHTAITFPLSICSLSLRRAQTAPQLTSWNSRSYLWLLSLSIISVSHSQNAPLSTSKHLGS